MPAKEIIFIMVSIKQILLEGLNRNIREKLYRFRISATAFGRIADADGDQRLQDLTQTKRYLSNEEILQNIWTDGNFEFRFKSYIAGETNKDAMEHLLTFSVKSKRCVLHRKDTSSS